MKLIVFILFILSYNISVAQTDSNISYVSPMKDTLMLPNDDIGHIIKEVWATTTNFFFKPVILLVDEETIKKRNKTTKNLNQTTVIRNENEKQ